MIFITVGSQLPFDRLVMAVDEALEDLELNEKVYAQIGRTSYQPANFEFIESLDKTHYDAFIRSATGIISHAGMGTIISALESNTPILVMPRQKKYGEAVNNHQVAIAKKFEHGGYLSAAYNACQLEHKIANFRSFVPKPRSNDAHAVMVRIAQYVNSSKA